MAKNKTRTTKTAASSKAGEVKEGKREAKAAAKKPAAGSAEAPEVLYQVKTKRTSAIIKAYITFTYRVFHPRVTARMVLYGLLIFVPGFLVKAQTLKIVLWTVGALVVLLGLFRQYISLAITKRSDADYRNGTEFVYEFTQNDASFFRDGELAAYSSKYKDIDAVFYDEDYYYLSLKSRELFVMPMDKFTIGDPSTFDDFIYKRCKKVCRWIPVKFSNRIKKMQTQRALAREELERMKK